MGLYNKLPEDLKEVDIIIAGGKYLPLYAVAKTTVTYILHLNCRRYSRMCSRWKTCGCRSEPVDSRR